MKARTPHLVVGIVIGLLASPYAVHSGANQESQSANLNELLKERRDTLRQLVKVVTHRYGQGTTGYESVVHASQQLNDAELELAEDRQARLVLLRQRVELMQSHLVRVEAKFLTGDVTNDSVLVAKADVLKAKIQLLREKGEEGEAGQ